MLNSTGYFVKKYSSTVVITKRLTPFSTSQDSSLGEVGSFLEGRGIAVRFLVGAAVSFRVLLRAHPASYPMDIGGSYPQDKRPRREAEVKNIWNYISTSS
jgi:hypothetical protein